MDMKVALAGNPNCGKTTLFNALTGSNQYVGNWPGVTVEKKEGKLKGIDNVTIVDLPGIYSLSPYTLEESVARDFLTEEAPDAVLNIVDGSNLERNLYLTTQIIEMGIPMLVAVNMIDVLERRGEKLDLQALSQKLGCPVVEMSAAKGEGIDAAAQRIVDIAQNAQVPRKTCMFSSDVERALSQIETMVAQSHRDDAANGADRFYAVKLLERDSKAMRQFRDVDAEPVISLLERRFDDDADGIIVGQRYDFIESVVSACASRTKEKQSATERIDKVVTNRVLALPIFVVVMFLVYFISVTSVGTWATDWANDGVFGDGWFVPFTEQVDQNGNTYEEATALFESEGAEEPEPGEYGLWVPGAPVLLGNAMESAEVDETVQSLVLDGAVAGVGAVLGFVPQLMVLFVLLALLESCGYMSRIAFILDKLFRRFGLSGKSFIPMLIATGCGVPGIMASRTIDADNDRRMTVMTTTFMPCSAKLPIIALFAGAVFGGVWWVAPSAYFLGIAMILASGIILKKTRAFAGNVAPFVMELPEYRMPTFAAVMRSMWERTSSFIKKAATVIFLASMTIWFVSSYGIVGGAFGPVQDADESILAVLSGAISWLFYPLGWGDWQAVSATVAGLIAKENVVSTLGVLYGGDAGWYTAVQAAYTPVAAYSLLAFNLLCAPCFAALGAIRREMASPKWFWATVGYQCGLAYGVALAIYQIGGLLTGEVAFNVFSVAAFALMAVFFYLLFRPAKKVDRAVMPRLSVAVAEGV